jgi:hypothetical protein
MGIYVEYARKLVNSFYLNENGVLLHYRELSSSFSYATREGGFLKG